MATYLANSPYYTTLSTNGYLDVLNYRDIPSQTDDISYTVTKDYEYRPDLLAYDLYRDAGLWWVFAARNPSIIQDPMFDLVAGLVIRLPKLSTIKKSLGI